MLFNSLSYAIFLPVVFIVYWYARKGGLKLQNIILLLASYFFYACWDYRFLGLLIFSTALDFVSGAKIDGAKTKNERKFWFWLSVIINLGFLMVFKYYNFFADSFGTFMDGFGLQINPGTLNVVLPVGISFYTFHGLSYVIDIYQRKIHSEKNIVDYSVFVSFFPLLVAGPIERATHLLPQIKKKRVFDTDKAYDGLRQILWGLFKKIVIADSCAQYANLIFNNYADYSGSTLLLGGVFFAIQIYGDFSGYSDIAIGTAKLFGIDLLRNFSYPYFSRDIAEFWRRWHISLSSWFKDYLYIPLGGSKVGMVKKIRNTFVIFLVSGFWHGANWTFIFWGLLNAVFIIPSVIFNTNRNNIGIVAEGRYLPTVKEFFSIVITFGLTVLAWIFFRAESLSHAFAYISHMLSKELFTIPKLLPWGLLTTIALFFTIEWIGREYPYALGVAIRVKRTPLRLISYYIVVLLILVLGVFKENQFIYFQF